MSEEAPAIVVAIEVDDPLLADRLSSLLGGTAGLRLADRGETATVTVTSRSRQGEPSGIELTPRERDVLAGRNDPAEANPGGFAVLPCPLSD